MRVRDRVVVTPLGTDYTVDQPSVYLRYMYNLPFCACGFFFLRNSKKQ